MTGMSLSQDLNLPEARERFLSLLLDRLTSEAPLTDDGSVENMLEQIADLVDCAGAYVMLVAFDEQGNVSLERRYAWYKQEVPALNFDGRRIKELERVYGQGPLVIPDSSLLPEEFADNRRELESRGLRSALMQPVFYDDRLRGFVGFNDDKPHDWSDSELDTVEQLARMVIGTLDKQLAERRLVEAEERFRSFMTATPSGVYCWEFAEPIDTALPVDAQLEALGSGVLVECNEVFASDFGLGTARDALGMTYADLAALNPEGFRLQEIFFIENGYQMIDYRNDVSLPEGPARTYITSATGLVKDGHLRRVWGSVRDITAQVKAEREIEASRQRIGLAVEAGGIGFFEWDPAHQAGYFEFPGSDHRESSRRDLASRDQLSEVLGDENIARLSAARQQYVSSDDEQLTCELVFKGEPEDVYLALQGRTFGNGPRDQQAIIGVTQDISRIRRAEAEKLRLEDQMRAAQKLESLGLLAGGIAHDFNNLLLSILGNADLAERIIPAGSPGREYLGDIGKAARVASDLCRQLLAYAGKGSFVLEPINPTVLVSEMRGLLESSINRRINLRFNFGKAPPIVADRSQMQQIILNLVINAGEAIGEGSGEVCISTGVQTCDSTYLAEPYLDAELPEGDYTFIEVSDTGEGMSGEIREKLFDPFFTTKFTGRGLGMSAVLGIVRGHEGSIKIYSEVGRGTTVRVLFPASSEEAEHTHSIAAEEDTPALPAGKVLFIDDDELVRSVGSAMLKQLGLEAVQAANGIEALKIYETGPEEFACVLLDLTMPEMDGIETFRHIRELNPHVKVVLASGYNEQEATRQFVGRGLAAFIQKPFVVTDLKRVLESVLVSR